MATRIEPPDMGPFRRFIATRPWSRWQRAQHLAEALNEIVVAINSTLDSDEILARVVTSSAEAIGCDSSGMYRRHADQWVATCLYRVPGAEEGRRYSDEEMPHLALASLAHRPVALDNAQADPRVDPGPMRALELRSVLAVPIAIRGELAGALAFYFHSSPRRFSRAAIDFAARVAGALSFALDNARLYDSIRLELKRTALLQDVAAASSSTLSLKELGERVLAKTHEHLAAARGSVYVLDEKERSLRSLALFGVPEKAAARVADLPRDAEVAIVSMLHRGLPFLTHETAARSPRGHAGCDLLGLARSSWICVPIRARERPLGAFALAFDGQRPFSDEEVAVYQSVAEQLGVAMENAMLFEARVAAEREATSELETSSRLLKAAQALSAPVALRGVLEALMDIVVEVTGRSRIIISLVDPAANELTVVSSRGTAPSLPGTRIPLEVFSAQVERSTLGRTTVVSDYEAADLPEQVRERARSFNSRLALFVPLVVGDRLIGNIALDEPGVRRPFGEREVGLVEGIAVHAAVAIENARLFEELQQANARLTAWVGEIEQRNREIELLAELSSLLQACVSADEVYAAVGRSARQMFPGESGAVFRFNPERNLLEAFTAWGEVQPDEQVISPRECWALRLGRPYLTEAGRPEMICTHIRRTLHGAYLDVPLAAQGEVMGLLHLELEGAEGGEAGEARERLKAHKQRLAVAVAENIALSLANVKLRETLYAQSIRDPLTGLFNRRYMADLVGRELLRGVRRKDPLGILMLDIDHFKDFNDAFGHEAGDALLHRVGEVLQASVRGEDFVCRYGGEEFVVVLHSTPVEAARQRAEQLRQELASVRASNRSQLLPPITVSLGVAVFPEHGATVEELLRVADVALYRAKTEGRDRVVVAG